MKRGSQCNLDQDIESFNKDKSSKDGHKERARVIGIPLSNAESQEELLRLNYFDNLQPLCSKVNRDIKKNNLEYGLL